MRPDTGARTILVALLLAAAPALASSESGHYHYEVSYDDRPIGTHSFEIDHSGAANRVRSRADFHVKLMFVSLYRYAHEAEELWQDGCLRQLTSRTNDNGQRSEVRLDEEDSGLRVDRLGPEPGTDLLQVDCAASFACWDLEQPERGDLINSQTGALTPVTLAFEGDDRLAGEPAHRYRLQPAGMAPIILWYRAGDRRWLQLETRRDSGVLRYRLTAVQPIPGPPLDQDADVQDPAMSFPGGR